MTHLLTFLLVLLLLHFLSQIQSIRKWNYSKSWRLCWRYVGNSATILYIAHPTTTWYLLSSKALPPYRNWDFFTTFFPCNASSYLLCLTEKFSSTPNLYAHRKKQKAKQLKGLSILKEHFNHHVIIWAFFCKFLPFRWPINYFSKTCSVIYTRGTFIPSAKIIT